MQAEKDFRTAKFYDDGGHVGSAYFYYELVCRLYPGTPSAEAAARRLKELRGRLEKPAAAPEEKPPARVGQIFITGNTRTRQSVILDAVPLFPGQVLTSPDLRASQRNLERLGRFKSASVTVLDPDVDGEYKDILIAVEEK
jgi:hypothetical protein